MINSCRIQILLIFLGLISGCSSAPHYENMPTLEQKVASDEDIRPGMVLTKNGAVVDIAVEEVQAQKARLEKENNELKERIKKLQADLDQERQTVLVLRMSAHPPREPASENQE